MSNDSPISPVQLLIDSQKLITQELIEQRKVNAALNEAIYKLSSEIKVLSNEIRKQDSLDERIGSLYEGLNDIKHKMHDSIESRITTKLSAIDERIKILEKSLYRITGATALIVFAISAIQPVRSLLFGS